MKPALLFPFIAGVCFTSAHAADWTSDWSDNAAVTNPSSYRSQQRGFYTLGGFQSRINLERDHLMSVTLPRFKFGCGGMDLLYGGISFLDEDFIVQKIENIMQAAPYVAWQMGVKTLSEKLSGVVSDAEDISNFMNSITLDDCAIAEGAVQTVVDLNDGKGVAASAQENILSNIYNQDLLDKALTRNRQETSDETGAAGDIPNRDIGTKTEGYSGLLYLLDGSAATRSSGNLNETP